MECSLALEAQERGRINAIPWQKVTERKVKGKKYLKWKEVKWQKNQIGKRQIIKGNNAKPAKKVKKIKLKWQKDKKGKVKNIGQMTESQKVKKPKVFKRKRKK